MLTQKKITMEAKCVIDEIEVVSFTAVIKPETNDVTMYTRKIDTDMYAKHRKQIREDSAEFEDQAYAMLEELVANAG